MNQDVAPTRLAEADTELIGEHVRHLLASMGFGSAKIRCQSKPPHLYIHIEAGAEGKLLIGAHGAHLAALQHIIRSIMRSTLPAGTRILVDVNSYRAHREQELVAIAEAAAGKALMQGQTVNLPPMTAADRRVIHTALANRPDLRTISQGNEPHRSVVVKPVSL
jgi:spoIIIJ-associated protein